MRAGRPAKCGLGSAVARRKTTRNLRRQIWDFNWSSGFRLLVYNHGSGSKFIDFREIRITVEYTSKTLIHIFEKKLWSFREVLKKKLSMIFLKIWTAIHKIEKKTIYVYKRRTFKQVKGNYFHVFSPRFMSVLSCNSNYKCASNYTTLVPLVLNVRKKKLYKNIKLKLLYYQNYNWSHFYWPNRIGE